MSYTDRFKIADDMIKHLDSVVHTITDPFISLRYTGFVAVAAVTVYELAIKDILVDFAKKKHKVFGTFAQNRFDRLNGRIKLDSLYREHVHQFGDKYLKRFKKRLLLIETQFLRQNRVSVKNAYNNIISWRHEFVHQGQITNATYTDVVDAYSLGKEVITCLAQTMNR